MPKALFTTHTAKLTGSAMSLLTLLTGLDKSALEPVVLLAEDGPLAQQLRATNTPYQVVPYAGWRKLLTVPRAKAFLKRHGVELVYLNCAVGFSRAVAIAAKQLGLPVVWHLREPPDSSRVRRNLPWMRRLADQIVVVSEEQREKLVSAGAQAVLKIDNGVDTRRFHAGLDGQAFRAAHGLPADAFVFGAIGTIEARKNTLQFVQAAAQLATEGPAFHLLIVGKGRDAYADQVRQFIAQTPLLAQRVVFTGEIWEVPDAMAAMDCLVMPSLWEGFPRVLLESLSVGTPAIASDVGEVRYMLNDGAHGLIVPPGDLPALLAAMREAISHPERLRQWGQLASADVAARFSQQAHVQHMTQVLLGAAKSSH